MNFDRFVSRFLDGLSGFASFRVVDIFCGGMWLGVFDSCPYHIGRMMAMWNRYFDWVWLDGIVVRLPICLSIPFIRGFAYDGQRVAPGHRIRYRVCMIVMPLSVNVAWKQGLGDHLTDFRYKPRESTPLSSIAGGTPSSIPKVNTFQLRGRLEGNYFGATAAIQKGRFKGWQLFSRGH